ncbi:MAG: hypothetical protein M3Z04_09465 [Chloroflexota bacterium]|nr:hypothetical protein [Chloroflexota bacterium]
MVKINPAGGRKDDLSAYGRVFGDVPLGKLFSKVHAAAISAGTELEKLLISESPYSMTYADFIQSLEQLTLSIHPILLIYNLPSILRDEKHGAKADFLLIDPKKGSGIVLELKGGDNFDTKKSGGELSSLLFLAQHYSGILGMPITYALSFFHAVSRSQILSGSKTRFDNDHVLTGRELCTIIGISYEAIEEKQKPDQIFNLNYFIDQLLVIDKVRAAIATKLAEQEHHS